MWFFIVISECMCVHVCLYIQRLTQLRVTLGHVLSCMTLSATVWQRQIMDHSLSWSFLGSLTLVRERDNENHMH